jgi:threonine/homoserine/homoserine lactone efflux protein
VVGLVCGLGCATALALYGGVAGCGLTVVASTVLVCQSPLLCGGALFLGYLGVSIYRTPGALPAASTAPSRGGLRRAFATTFALTLVNPLVVVYFVAAIAGNGLAHVAGSYDRALPLVLGIFAGSALWWALLSGSVALLRTRLNAFWLGWANRASGLVIAVLGIRILLQMA